MKYKCITCSHIWIARTDKKPRQCPSCWGRKLTEPLQDTIRQDTIKPLTNAEKVSKMLQELTKTLKEFGLKDPDPIPFDYTWTKTGKGNWTDYGKAVVFLEKGEKASEELRKTIEKRKKLIRLKGDKEIW